MYMVTNEPASLFKRMYSELNLWFHQLNWRHLAFYIGVPLLFAIYSSLEVQRFLEIVPFWVTLAFYAGHALVPWWLACVITQAVKVTLKSLGPHQLVIMLLGIGITLVLSMPYGQWLEAHYLAQLGSDTFSVNAPVMTVPYDMDIWSNLTQPILAWVGVNYFFDRFLNFPRYRYASDSTAQDSHDVLLEQTKSTAEPINDTDKVPVALPRFLDHISETTGLDEIYAIKAEQHYIRIYTREQNHMILYRFSDAVAEIDKDIGMQVHRSFWVRKDAIDRIESEKKKMFVRLISDLQVPVSQPYYALVKQAFESQN